MTDRHDPETTPARPVDAADAVDPVDPDEHPAHVEEWRDDAVPSSDVDEEAVIDEKVPTAIRTDRGDTIIVPDDDRPVVLSDDDELSAGGDGEGVDTDEYDEDA
jgi:hypothetical protein